MTTQQSQTWQTVCDQTDLIPHSGVAAKVRNQQIALYYLPETEQVFAIDNFCPFAAANVLSRGILGDLQGQTVVASPIYKQHFSLTTGQCLEDQSVSVSVYPARLEDARVQVAL